MRHPIERLLSAYRDRVVGLKFTYKFYTKVALTLRIKRKDAWLPAIMEGKKKPALSFKPDGRWVTVPTWPEFVSYILRTNPRIDVSIRRIHHNCWEIFSLLWT